MNRKAKIGLLSVVVFVISTIVVLRGKRFYMYNMWPEEIDVTRWVVKHHYKPFYCDGRIAKLINPSPHIFYKQEMEMIIQELTVQNGLRNPPASIIDSVNCRYAYTYFISRDPVDVYQLFVKYAHENDTMYFRYEQGRVYGGLSKDGWVITSCD